MSEGKLTRRKGYEKLKVVVEDTKELDREKKDELIKFLDKELKLIDNKLEKQREKAAAKKAEGDELLEVIKSLLTNKYQTVDDIYKQIDGEGLTKRKIISRLTQLVNAEVIEKRQLKDENDKLVMNYKLID